MEPSYDEDVALIDPIDSHSSHTKPTPKSRCCSAPFIWFMSASTILPFGIVVCAFMMEHNDTPFSLAFVLGLITCIFGSIYFIPLITLKELIIESYVENQTKRMQTDRMHADIKKIEFYGQQLRKSRERILLKNKETKQLLKSIQLLNVDSFEELNVQKGRAQKVYKEWFIALLKKERVLLHTLYDRFEFLDDSPGMNCSEFNSFLQYLPDGYAQRMDRLGTFEKLSKGNGIILYEDFKYALDLFAEMEINDTDIDFDIERKETGIQIVKKSTKTMHIIKNKWFNVAI